MTFSAKKPLQNNDLKDIFCLVCKISYLTKKTRHWAGSCVVLLRIGLSDEKPAFDLRARLGVLFGFAFD